jgi:hypothetical protein
MTGAGSAALGGISSAINVFTFEDGTLERAGLLQSHQSQTVPPFLVVASNDVNQVGDPYQPCHCIIPNCATISDIHRCSQLSGLHSW